MTEKPLHVAIIGGGLCGLSLAIALTKRSISYTIYEARKSFSEIGAGINLGPNTIQAFDFIDPALSDAIYGLAARNEPGKETVWMTVRLGAPTERFEDGHLVTEIMGPPTGNMTVSRNGLLQLLAQRTQPEHSRFNKKLMSLRQSAHDVTMMFEDGTEDRASLVIGCDGAHSTVRDLLLDSNDPAKTAKYSEAGGYRAIFPMDYHEQAVGVDIAHNSTNLIGPGGYIIMYPIDGGQNANIGVWPWKRGEWNKTGWILPRQKPQMLEDLRDWGPTAQKVMSMMDDETAFWATFHHSVKPGSYFQGRVCMIGDAAHSMCPHQGQGAAQSMEDACVMAEVLRSIDKSASSKPLSLQIEAAFCGYQAIRKQHFEAVLDTSYECFSWWADFWRPDLTLQDLKSFGEQAVERWRWIWQPDITGQGERAKVAMREYLREHQKPQESSKLS